MILAISCDVKKVLRKAYKKLVAAVKQDYNTNIIAKRQGSRSEKSMGYEPILQNWIPAFAGMTSHEFYIGRLVKWKL